MGLNIFKEPFVGKFDGVTSPLLLKTGDISDGLNIRKVSPTGGWKVRKGCTLHNTSVVDSTNAVKSLHQYTHPKNEDYHFIAQCNSLLYDATTDPPTKGTTFGTSLGVTVGTTPGFSCMVNDHFIYADGSGTPICYGGTTPYPLAFLSKNDTAMSSFMDHTKEVIDADDETYAIVRGVADSRIVIVSYEPINAIHLEFYSGKENDAAAVMTVKAMRSGTLTEVSALDDDTDVSGDSMKQDGTISWTASALDTQFVYDRRMGYCYELTWNATLDEVGISKCTITQAAHTITNKWNGAYEQVAGCYFFDESTNHDYIDALAYVTSPSTALYIDISEATTSDFLMVGTVEPSAGFLIGVVKDYENTENAQIDLIEWNDGNVWQDEATFTDNTLAGTASFAITGSLIFPPDDLDIEWQKISLGLDRTPLYWSRISWDASLSTDVRVYFMASITNPIPLGTYDGCVEFKGRLILWGDKMYPNRFRYSSLDRFDCFAGIDSGYSQSFGAMDKLKVALNFYNELLVWKENSVWMWEGFDTVTFGSLRITDSVGLASPQTAKVVEVGTPGMSRDEPRSVAVWQDTDGVYALDGRKPRKVSMPIDNFFNPEYDTCIAATDIENLGCFTDPIRNTYHLLLPTDIDYYADTTLYVNELVYNYATDEWYPPWFRNLKLSCGVNLKGSDNRDYVYGGTSAGWIMKLENDTTDKTVGDVDVAIEHRLKTRGIAATQQHSSTTRMKMRHLWPEFKSKSAGEPTVNFYPDLADAATSLGTVSMINDGYALANPLVAASIECQGCFQAELTLDVADQEMEIWSMTYEHEVTGLPNL